MIKITSKKSFEKVCFSTLSEGDFFKHYEENEKSLYMKKTHMKHGESYQSIDMSGGQSLKTSDNSKCIVLDVEATVTAR